MGRHPAARRPARAAALGLGLAWALLVSAGAAAQSQDHHQRDASGGEAGPPPPRAPAARPPAEPPAPTGGTAALTEREKRCRAATRGCTMQGPCPPCDR
jgi:hypothetical protein